MKNVIENTFKEYVKKLVGRIRRGRITSNILKEQDFTAEQIRAAFTDEVNIISKWSKEKIIGEFVDPEELMFRALMGKLNKGE